MICGPYPTQVTSERMLDSTPGGLGFLPYAALSLNGLRFGGIWWLGSMLCVTYLLEGSLGDLLAEETVKRKKE